MRYHNPLAGDNKIPRKILKQLQEEESTYATVMAEINSRNQKLATGTVVSPAMQSLGGMIQFYYS